MDWSSDQNAAPGGDRILTRDPFQDLDVDAEPEESLPPDDAPPEAEPAPADTAPPPKPAAAPPAWAETDEAELDVRLETVEHAGPAMELRGKGVWLLYSGDIDRAIEMADTIGATYILCKTGHQGMFFVESARRIHDQVRQAGLTPVAWAATDLDNPLADAKMAIKSAQAGYEGFVFRFGDETGGKALAAKTLGWQLLEANFDPGRLYYAAPPSLHQRPQIPYQAINRFCRGGFMPLCFLGQEPDPRTVVDEWIYGDALGQWAEAASAPPIYPVLGSFADEDRPPQPDATEFLQWAQALEDHDPDFFSVYHAGSIGHQLWPILAAMGRPAPLPSPVTPPSEAEPEPEPPAEETMLPPLMEPEPTPPPERFPLPELEPPPEPAPAPPQPEPGPEPPTATYHKVTVNDTVWGICRQYGIDRAEFWKWNGHLWDEVGMPRDTLYLQDGWRVRVG
ncbi:MAG: LysM domain-containing protein [Anaerolineae bacterium]|jgi:hypothetical protein